MTHRAHPWQSPQYRSALEEVELMRPVQAATIRNYIDQLHAEAAQNRVRASLLESQLETLTRGTTT